jgi:DNA (cytosine-5)-methyltransferase 1
MKFISLFAGIGGFDLGFERAGMKCVAQVEIDQFCQKVLEKHWPDVPRFGDIHNVGKHNLPETDVICGGFPCQPFSIAGKRRGKNDDRHLWPQMFRVIQETKPRWIVGENVANFINMALEQSISDLESIGYEVQPFIIPACAVNAPHQRDRVWIVANSEHNGISSTQETREYRQEKSNVATWQKLFSDESQGVDILRSENIRWIETSEYSSWNKRWFDIATELCGMDDGLPVGLDGFELTAKAHRAKRLKALGNAVIPQIPEIIARSILQIETHLTQHGADFFTAGASCQPSSSYSESDLPA